MSRAKLLRNQAKPHHLLTPPLTPSSSLNSAAPDPTSTPSRILSVSPILPSIEEAFLDFVLCAVLGDSRKSKLRAIRPLPDAPNTRIVVFNDLRDAVALRDILTTADSPPSVLRECLPKETKQVQAEFLVVQTVRDLCGPAKVLHLLENTSFVIQSSVQESTIKAFLEERGDVRSFHRDSATGNYHVEFFDISDTEELWTDFNAHTIDLDLHVVWLGAGAAVLKKDAEGFFEATTPHQFQFPTLLPPAPLPPQPLMPWVQSLPPPPPTHYYPPPLPPQWVFVDVQQVPGVAGPPPPTEYWVPAPQMPPPVYEFPHPPLPLPPPPGPTPFQYVEEALNNLQIRDWHMKNMTTSSQDSSSSPPRSPTSTGTATPSENAPSSVSFDRRPRKTKRKTSSTSTPYSDSPVALESSLNPPGTPRQNLLDLVKIASGTDTRTTVMIKNIPNKLSSDDLYAFISAVVPRRVDFLYLRMDFSNACNFGYAFVNFMGVEDLLKFAKERVGRKWNLHSSSKILEMCYANYQGKEALVEKFKNSAIMDERPEWRPRIFNSTPGPEQGLEETFPEATHRGRKERGSRELSSVTATGSRKRRDHHDNGVEVIETFRPGKSFKSTPASTPTPLVQMQWGRGHGQQPHAHADGGRPSRRGRRTKSEGNPFGVLAEQDAGGVDVVPSGMVVGV
ncbi:hypothetical protein V5O48_007661 [Marasmius crinis-equi]|uniref:Mei2-like C-terminal RNA recognition motif domain-containing protein n=1 Tax=Marasmius crinis-equi TaxID=585013 RepID=A0ABR3FGJ2_9AGAR